MKKTLLLSAALLAASTPMLAQFKAQILPDAPFMSVSQNGKYGIFTLNGQTLAIVNLDNPEDAAVYFDDRGLDFIMNEYLPGYGTCVANDGSAVGNAVLYEMTSETTYDQTDNAVIYKGGELKILPSPRPDLFNMAHAITPDGSVICGNVGNDNFDPNSKKIMMLPAVWYRNDKGEYDDPIVLPHPETDFLGGVPQYVTANAISADGNTVAGTVTATSGFWVYPIVYTRDAEGKWSYKLPCLNQLFYTNPDIKVPAEPGEYPDLMDYLTQEEKDAYEAAVKAWQEAGGNDWDNYPKYEDFQSEEEKAAYEAAVIKYQTDKEAYDAAVDQATAGSITFTFNNVVLSPDGKLFSSTYAPDSGFGPMMPSAKAAKYSRMLNRGTRDGEIEDDYTAKSYVINLEDDTYKVYSYVDGANVTCAADNGKFVGYAYDNQLPVCVVMDPEKGVVPVEEYYKETCPEFSAWVNENMKHEVESYDMETGEPYLKEMMLSGVPCCTPDMNTMLTQVLNSFDFADPTYYFGYVFQGIGDNSGVKEVLAKDSVLRVLRDGVINVNGEAYVEVFAADGAKVFAGNASGNVNTGLGNGIYVVRAKFADGKVRVCKAMF